MIEKMILTLAMIASLGCVTSDEGLEASGGRADDYGVPGSVPVCWIHDATDFFAASQNPTASCAALGIAAPAGEDAEIMREVASTVRHAWKTADYMLVEPFLASTDDMPVRLLRVDLFPSTSASVGADGSLQYGAGEGEGGEEQTPAPGAEVALGFRGETSGITMQAHFQIGTHPSSPRVSAPINYWRLLVTGNASASVSPSQIATTMLSVPPALSQALGSLVDNIGNASFSASYTRETRWVQESFSRTVECREAPEGYEQASQLAHLIARDLLRVACMEGVAQGYLDRSRESCALKYAASQFEGSAVAVSAYRALRVRHCERTSVTHNGYYIRQLYAVAPRAGYELPGEPIENAPDYLDVNADTRLWMYWPTYPGSSSFSTRVGLSKKWGTLQDADVTGTDAARCGDFDPVRERCIRVDLGELSANTCGDIESGALRILSLGNAHTISIAPGEIR